MKVYFIQNPLIRHAGAVEDDYASFHYGWIDSQFNVIATPTTSVSTIRYVMECAGPPCIGHAGIFAIDQIFFKK